MPLAETLCLSSSLYERVKEATAHTAQRLAACSISSSCLLYLRQLLLTLHFHPHALAVALSKKGQIFLVSCALGHSGRGQAPGQHPVLHVSELHHYLFVVVFLHFLSDTNLPSLPFKLSDDLHCFKAL